MNALSSALGGLCICWKDGKPSVIDVVNMTTLRQDESHLICGVIEDWEVVNQPNQEAVIREAVRRYRITRAVSNVETCLLGVSDGIRNRLILEVEELFIEQEIRNHTERRLLSAPLVTTEGIVDLVRDCLSSGLATTASLLENIRESQPLLTRLVDRWISIPDDLFFDLSDGRQSLWRIASESGVIVKTLKASTYQHVESAWGSLVFLLESPTERSVVVRVSKAVAKMLFPTYDKSDANDMLVSETDQSSSDHRLPRQSALASKQGLDRALKQIDSITDAVSKGSDAKAKLYLQSLVEDQLKHEGGERYAVKSLCNIAQQCAEMFRTDFEHECLNMAITVSPGDGWARIQLADHLKRVGQFDMAIQELDIAKQLGQGTVAKSSLADVYVQMGRHKDAIEIYDSIESGQQDPVIRGAKADVLRRWGHLDEANTEYEKIIVDGQATDRVYAGKAEIAKRKGQLNQARTLYDELIKRNYTDNASLVVYKMAQANVLMRLNSLEAAYSQLDEVVQLRPFAMQARTYRAAVAGLLGRPHIAILEVLPLTHTSAFNEWGNEYVRGLLLLMLDRYSDAKVALIKEAGKDLLDSDSSRMFRLAAAACFLQTRQGVDQADLALRDVSDMQDVFADNILCALKLHVAVTLRRDSEMRTLLSKLNTVDDRDLKELVLAISNRDWRKACDLEVRALLRLAA